MTDTHRKKRLDKRFNKLRRKAKQAEEAGDNEEAIRLYNEMVSLLENAASLLGSGERRVRKEHVIEKIHELGGEVPGDLSSDLSDENYSTDSEEAGTDPNQDFESTESIEDVDSSVIDVCEPDHSFSDVGGRERLKQVLQREVLKPLRNREEYERYGLSVVNGILFYGPPGTGKTWLAKALAGELGVPVVESGGSRLKSRYLGNSEENVRQLFDIAREFNAMIFIDEIDQILQDRSDLSNSGKSDMVNEFLNQMVSLKGESAFVVGATNYPDNLDRAALNPVRFSEQLKVELPSEQTRYEILQTLLRRRPDPDVVTPNAIDLRSIAAETHGYSASDLELVIRKASTQAVEQKEPITQRNLKYGVEKTSPSVSK
jgi:transitional endoplasmic reticulum ATPase